MTNLHICILYSRGHILKIDPNRIMLKHVRLKKLIKNNIKKQNSKKKLLKEVDCLPLRLIFVMRAKY